MRYLNYSGADPYSNKDGISIETFKHVALAVNLACINFVEKRHQNERVEYDGEMLWGRRVHNGVFIATTVNVEHHITYTHARDMQQKYRLRNNFIAQDAVDSTKYIENV